MATAKQLAALKKGRAKLAAKRGKKKTTAKKRKAKTVKRKAIKRKKVSVNAKSRATGKKPSKRLKARRRKNTVKGCYPNPDKAFIYAVKGAKRFYLQKVADSWNFVDRKPSGFTGPQLAGALKALNRLKSRLPPGVKVYLSGKKK